MSTLQEWIIDIPAVRDEAKALWGASPVLMNIEMRHIDDPIYTDQEAPFAVTKPAYLYHLETMLKSDNPVEYYEQHKPKGK